MTPYLSAESKGIIFRVPYHGRAEKEKIDFLRVYPQTLERMAELIDADLLEETETEIRLMPDGWYWYVNLMYYMLPDAEQMMMDHRIEAARGGLHRRLDDLELMLPACEET